MAASEALAIERLVAADIAGGLALSDAAGWNQTADDWAFFIAAGKTIGVRDEVGRLVASAAALPYGGGVGWIAMVLVDEEHRHRGLASRLVASCVETIARSGRVPVLDATPAGAEVYRRSGFVAGFAFERWQGDVDATDRAAADRDVDLGDPDSVAALVAIDRPVSGVGRAALLGAFAGRPATRAWLSDDRSGFVMTRSGRRATQIGPLIANDAAAAVALVERALAGVAGRVFIDTATHQPALQRALAARGFVRQRPFVRMALAATPVAALAASPRLFAVAGPEFG
jgi:GNAT superfamily N-acetyltransferase